MYFLCKSETFRNMRLSRAFSRGGLAADLFLVMVLLSLAYVFFSRRGPVHEMDQNIPTERETKSRSRDRERGPQERYMGSGTIAAKVSKFHAVQKLIDTRVDNLPDARHSNCKQKTYRNLAKATIIIDFWDFEFYSVKTAISSVIKHTNMDLIDEILVIDDGSTVNEVKERSVNYVKQVPRARLIRTGKNRIGTIQSRMLAAEQAKGEVLVFLDHTVMCNKGWLEPLIQYVLAEGNVIGVPHFDNILDPVTYEYYQTPSNLISTFTWSLDVQVVSDEKINPTSEPFKIPVMRGNIFTVSRAYFTSIKGYDKDFDDGGGENLELSFRTWLCGGSISIVPCSRVAVLNLADPVKVSSHRGIRRVVRLWLGNSGDVVYKQTGADSRMPSSEETSFKRRKAELRDLKCKTFDWYFKNIAAYVKMPTPGVSRQGVLRCSSGRCARVGRDGRIDLGRCDSDHYKVHPVDMIFEWHQKGRIMVSGQCLSVDDQAYINAVPCSDSDKRQSWKLENGVLMNFDLNGFCAMHVTDPQKAKKKLRQVMMAQECNLDNDMRFNRWAFIPVPN